MRANGCDAVLLRAVPDRLDVLDAAVRDAFATHDVRILSGGTSKGVGDLTTQVIAGLGAPGIVAHGVALKPSKPLCLAVCDGKPVVVLPGFPTTAMFTFHEMVASTLRRMAGLPPSGGGAGRGDAALAARLGTGASRVCHGGADQGPAELVAHPVSRGSGAVTPFARADGFVTVPALAESLASGTQVEVTLFGPQVTAPALAIIGSHCVGLDAVIGRLFEAACACASLPRGRRPG